MKKIYLFCSAGMSTSMLASNMQDVASFSTQQTRRNH